jgi:hypothetical protein
MPQKVILKNKALLKLDMSGDTTITLELVPNHTTGHDKGSVLLCCQGWNLFVVFKGVRLNFGITNNG